MQSSISLIISAYNEDTIIEDCVYACIAGLSKHFTDYEIILINDASTDRTGQLIDSLATSHQNIIVHHNTENQNMGESIQFGMLIASKDYISFNAADLPFDPSLYKEIIDKNPDADMIVVERKKYSGTTTKRRLLSLINRALMFLFFPRLKKDLKDTNYLQIIRKPAILKIIPMAQGPIFTWPEMIFRARRLGMSVVTAEAEYEPMHIRKGAFGKPRDILQALGEMLRFRWLLWRGKI